MNKRVRVDDNEESDRAAAVVSGSLLMRPDRCLFIDEVDEAKRAIKNGDILGRLWSFEDDGWAHLETTRTVYIYRSGRKDMYLFAAASCLRAESTLARRQRVIEIMRKA